MSAMLYSKDISLVQKLLGEHNAIQFTLEHMHHNKVSEDATFTLELTNNDACTIVLDLTVVEVRGLIIARKTSIENQLVNKGITIRPDMVVTTEPLS